MPWPNEKGKVLARVRAGDWSGTGGWRARSFEFNNAAEVCN